jgi:hypothetical protein
MNLETFCTTVVPGIASAAYFSAGVANLWMKNYPLAVMWLCYSLANICLLMSVKR